MTELKEVLEKFHSKLSYQKLDATALDISRAAAAGNLGEGKYAEWAMVDNDELVVPNLVRTFVTTTGARLSSHPFKPLNETLSAIGQAIRLNALFTAIYHDVLNDGYAFAAIGMSNGKPQVRQVDSRFILFDGTDPTLKDCNEIVIFEIVPRKPSEYRVSALEVPQEYVQYDTEHERVITNWYTREDDIFVLYVYDGLEEEPKRYPLPGLDRIPVVRFVGDKVELPEDHRFHYRGIYYAVGGVYKAMALSATKVQIRTANSDDDNYLASSSSVDNHSVLWENDGVKLYDDKDGNGDAVPAPIPIEHDNQFLISSFEMWKSLITEMLGPVVQSGSEAVTQEEVMARNEVKDAISNQYLTRMADSVEEVYRCIQMFMTGNGTEVQVLGGYLELVKRNKERNEVMGVYQLAKESGLNAQGFVLEILRLSDLDPQTKLRIESTLKQDPFASPKVVELQAEIQKLNQTIQQKDIQLGLMRLQATQRLERQAEFVAMTERTKQADIALKQWQQETKDTTAAKMELLKKALEVGDLKLAMQVINSIEAVDPSVLADNAVQNTMIQTTNDYQNSAERQLAESGAVQGGN